MPEKDLERLITDLEEELHWELGNLDERQRKTDERLQRIEGQLRRLLVKDDEELGPAESETEQGIDDLCPEDNDHLYDSKYSLTRASMSDVLYKRFGMNMTAESWSTKHDGKWVKIGFTAHSFENKEEAYLVHQCSRLKTDDIDWLVEDLTRAQKFFDEFRGKKLYGIIAVSHPSPQAEERVLREGFYYGTITDEIFELKAPPEGFKPRVFGTWGE